MDVKNIRQEEEECRKFLGIAGDDLNIKEEIKKCYDHIVTNYLKEKFSEILKQSDLKKEEKETITKQLSNNIKDIIENLNSSYQFLEKSMDINEFIKVKRVKDNQFRSEIIKGFAMTKSAFSKIKGINRENTKILILNFDLNEHEIRDPFIDITKKEKNKDKKDKNKEGENGKNKDKKISWADEIFNLIESLNVNLILINKGIDNKLLEKLEISKIIAINVKSKSLKKIAGCTKGIAISSLDEFKNYVNNKEEKEDDKNKKQNFCGSCVFDIVDIKKFSEEKMESVICYDDINDYPPEIFEKIIFRPKYKLMKFETKNNDYFRTLLLRGTNKVLLDKIKKALKEEIFITLRDFFLQQKVLHFLFCKVEFILPSKEEEKEKKEIINNDIIITNNNNNLDINIKLDNKNNNNLDIINNNIFDNKDNKIIPKMITVKRMIDRQNEKKKKDNENTDVSNNDQKTNVANATNETKEINRQISKKIVPQIAKVNNIIPISNPKDIKEEIESPKTSQFNPKLKPPPLSQKSIPTKTSNNQKRESNKNLNALNEINKEENFKNFSHNKPKVPAVMKEPQSSSKFSGNSGNMKNSFYEEAKNNETSNFLLDQNDIEIKSINLNPNDIERNDFSLNPKDFENKQKHKYQFGFDVSIISKNKQKKTKLDLLKLKMCKGDKNFDITLNDIAANNKTLSNKKKEAELLKKLNYICGRAENMELMFYESDEQKDKLFGKFIIDMIYEGYKKCPNEKCRSNMSNHYYYLYNSEYSQIKISYISKDDSNLEQIIKYIQTKDEKFIYSENVEQIGKIDYNIDIYSYGFCQKNKKIVTPLTKMPKDFLVYSTAEFFKHILYNSNLKNRNGIEFNLINAYKDSPEIAYFSQTCRDSSFQDISRIFVTKFGSLKFEYKSLDKYEILSVQQNPNNEENIEKDEKKSVSVNNIQISNDNKESKEYNNKNYFEISDLIGNALKIEKDKIEKLLNKEEKSDIKIIAKNLINLLNDLIDYILKDSSKDSNSNNSERENSDIKKKHSQASQRTSIDLTNEGKDLTMNFKELINSISGIDYSKKLGLYKKIAFRICQFKILYNKIKILFHKIKLYISLEHVLSMKNKEKTKDNADLITKKAKKNDNDEDKNDKKDSDNEDDEISLSKVPFDLKPKIEETSLITQKSSSSPINTSAKFDSLKEIPFEEVIKKLIDSYLSIDEIENADIIGARDEYKNMLQNIIFYEEKPNDFSSIIKENDLSSIISYGISSLEYKNHFKDKTNLLGFKKNEASYSNTNSTHSIYTEIEKERDYDSIKLDQDLYDSLFIFERTNTPLESEILSGEKIKLPIQVKSIDPEKFNPKNNESPRKTTVSRQTKGAKAMPLSSPMPFSPQKDIYEEIEKKLGIIEDKISVFFSRFEKLSNDMMKREVKFKISVKECYKTLQSIKVEYDLINNIQEGKEGNIILDEKQKIDFANIKQKKVLLDGFIASVEDQTKNKAPFQEKTNPLESPENKEEEPENNLNLIEIIGKLIFKEDRIPKSEIELKIYFPRQFEALRIAYCSTYEDLLVSIMESGIWTEVSGGKSNSKFYKTKDEKYLFKSIKPDEFNMFTQMAISYFHHMDEYLFHKMPSLLMKILGVYEINIKKEEKGKMIEENYYLMMMENLNYGLNLTKGELKSYDLKGSITNRYINKDILEKNKTDTKEDKKPEKITNIVLYDNNFKEDFKTEPIPLNKKLYDLLILAVHNDTLFLSKMGVVDYSLLLHIYTDERKKKKYLRMGIIDYVRKYTWDKQLEHYIKIFINGFVIPTIIDPNQYKDRFKEAIQDYFIGV